MVCHVLKYSVTLIYWDMQLLSLDWTHSGFGGLHCSSFTVSGRVTPGHFPRGVGCHPKEQKAFGGTEGEGICDSIWLADGLDFRWGWGLGLKG